MARCAICGRNRRLAKEHVPPKKAYNNSGILLYRIDKYAQEGAIRWRGKKQKSVFIRKSLCSDCNNTTGARYGESYVDFTRQVASIADRANPETEVLVSLYIYPARVVKQVLAMFCATCGPRLADAHPLIRKRILAVYSLNEGRHCNRADGIT